jgi:hypothetical protein
VYLSGLNGVIVDQFDSGALSQPQIQALKDFVGLGGTLILAGGASWRRQLLPLPAELLPLRPTATGTTSLGALADLGGLASTVGVQVADGDVASWASVAVAAPDGHPLIVEGPYGAGRVLALTFDPLGQPLDTQLTLAGLAWSQAISRGLSGAQGPSPYFSKIGFGTAIPGGPVSTLGGAGPGSWSAFPGNMQQIFSDSAAGLSPPFGMLAVLLVVYGLLVTVLSYLVLKAAAPRGLLWVVVPGVAIAFTGGSYGLGFVSRGSDFQVTHAQVQWLGPGGVVETDSFDGVVPPRRGDLRLTAAPNTVVSTATMAYGPTADQAAEITIGRRTEVLLANVPVWDLRPVQTLTVTHPFASGPGSSAPIEAHLRLDRGRIRGEVVNHTPRTVRDLQLLTGSGSGAPLVSTLGPGATVTVDASLSPGVWAGTSGKGVISAGLSAGPATHDSRRALAELAATRGVGRPGELVLVASTDAIDTLRIEGGSMATSERAALVEPVRLQSADSLAAIAPVARLVSSYVSGGSDLVDAYELDLPPGVSGRVGLTLAAVGPSPAAAPVEVYDWDLHTWRPLPVQYSPGQAPAQAALTRGETATGVVRVRVHENAPGQSLLSATGLP